MSNKYYNDPYGYDTRSKESVVEPERFDIAGFKKIISSTPWCVFWAFIYFPICVASMWIGNRGPMVLRIPLTILAGIVVGCQFWVSLQN